MVRVTKISKEEMNTLLSTELGFDVTISYRYITTDNGNIEIVGAHLYHMMNSDADPAMSMKESFITKTQQTKTINGIYSLAELKTIVCKHLKLDEKVTKILFDRNRTAILQSLIYKAMDSD